MSVKTLAKSVGVGRFATGIYTGDGGVTQAIIGVGFQPIALIIYAQVFTVPTPAFKTDQDGLFAYVFDAVLVGPNWRWQTDFIISLDADGFTVGDGTPIALNYLNVADRPYAYVCWG